MIRKKPFVLAILILLILSMLTDRKYPTNLAPRPCIRVKIAERHWFANVSVGSPNLAS